VTLSSIIITEFVVLRKNIFVTLSKSIIKNIHYLSWLKYIGDIILFFIENLHFIVFIVASLIKPLWQELKDIGQMAGCYQLNPYGFYAAIMHLTLGIFKCIIKKLSIIKFYSKRHRRHFICQVISFNSFEKDIHVLQHFS